MASRGSQRCRGAENPQNSRDLDTNKDYDTGGTAGKENACPGCVCVCVCVTHSRPGCEVTVCVCVSLVRVVIICLASTHTALVSSPSLAVLHLSTYLYLPTALQVLQVRKETLHRHEPVVSLVRSRRAPPAPPIVLPKSCSCRWGPCPPPPSLVWVCLFSFFLSSRE